MSRIYIDLENLLKEKNVSKNKLCQNCRLQRTQLNNYCKNKIGKVDLNVLERMCTYLECMPSDILKYEDKLENEEEK